MILNLFRRTASEAIVERLYQEIVAASRRPVFFTGPAAVADTWDGRFEVLALHASAVLRRLSALPPPAVDLAQELTDRMFRGFDEALRESGVGDLTVPKRMKRLAGDFGGRATAYAQAGTDAELAAAIARNVYGVEGDGRAEVLAHWLRATELLLSTQTLVDFEKGLPALPMPDEATANTPTTAATEENAP